MSFATHPLPDRQGDFEEDEHDLDWDHEPHGSHDPLQYRQMAMSRSRYAAVAGECCPHCGSHRTTVSHVARRIGSAIGTLAGAVTATARATAGAQLGAQLGAMLTVPTGPAGMTFGAAAGAVLGAMVGAAAGCAVGAALGEAIDAKILHSHRCLACQRGFTQDTA